jgi:hypothetical protein
MENYKFYYRIFLYIIKHKKGKNKMNKKSESTIINFTIVLILLAFAYKIYTSETVMLKTPIFEIRAETGNN